MVTLSRLLSWFRPKPARVAIDIDRRRTALKRQRKGTRHLPAFLAKTEQLRRELSR